MKKATETQKSSGGGGGKIPPQPKSKKKRSILWIGASVFVVLAILMFMFFA
jgi:hypothetical protein